MSKSSRALARIGCIASAVRQGFYRVIYGKHWACTRYQRRHETLAGPRPGANLG